MEPVKIYNTHIAEMEESQQKKIVALATLLHESWREGRYDLVKKSYEPRIKTTSDKEWQVKHNNQNELDIANTSFENLPSDWQEENILSAKVAIEKIEDVLNLIHDNWLDRNDMHATLEQRVQYSKLSNDEKLKDIDVLEEAVKILRSAC